jgi:hypothetical protein
MVELIARRARRNGTPARVEAPSRRLASGVCAAVAAFAAAVAAAVGPAHGRSAEYSWPPPSLPHSEPAVGWYAPLPLLNRVPASLLVDVPCGLAPPLRNWSAVTVLATARHPARTEALRMVLEHGSLRITVGPRTVRTEPWPESCPLRVTVEDGLLRERGRTLRLNTGTPGEMPVVTGLFSGLDLRAGEAPRIAVHTKAYATSWTDRQTLAGALFALLALVALISLGPPVARSRLRVRLARSAQSVWRARDATDAVVVAVLLVWWIVAPTFYDDGWFWVINRVSRELGSVSLYYDNWGVNQPLGYWLERLRYWSVGSTNDLVVMRLPALGALIATWLLCRRCLRMVKGVSNRASFRWVLAAAFLVGAVSWGMTVRLEPFVALLAVTCLAAMGSFVLEPRLTPFMVALPAAALAATAHPAGLVAAAPLIAATPETIRWLQEARRSRALGLSALLIAALALTLVTFTLGADLHTRLADGRLLRTGDYFYEPWQEYIRYLHFDLNGGGTATRHLSLALLLLSVYAWLVAGRWSRRDVTSLPTRSLAIGLLLLALVPSKWPWHFGSFIGIGAVAVATEVARLTRATEKSSSRPGRAGVALIVLAGVVAWAWNAHNSWSVFDLQQVRWSEAFGLTHGTLAGLALCAGGMAVGLYCSSRLRELLPRLFPGITAGLVLAVVGATVMVLVHDASVSPWSPARQNLEALTRGNSCGLAHHVRGNRNFVQTTSDPSVRTLLEPPVALYFPCATIPAVRGGVIEIPQSVVYASDPWPLRQRDAPFAAIPDLFEMRPVARGAQGLEILSVAGRIPQFARVDAVRRSE